MIDLHPPWAAFAAYALVTMLGVAAWWLLSSRRETRRRLQVAADRLALHKARYASVVDAASDAVISIDDEQRIVLFNAAAERMFGCDAAQALGADLARFVVPEARERHREFIDEFARSGMPHQAMHISRELAALRADGTRFAVEASVSQSDDPGTSGQRRIYTVLMRDISERKRAEAALRDSEARYRAMFDQAVVGIAQIDVQGRFLSVNARYCEMLGRTREELLQMRFHELTHPDDLPHNLALMNAVLEGGAAFTLQKRYLRKDGTTMWVENAVNAIRGADGSVASFVGTSIDIDERQRAAEALERSHEELRRLSASLTQAREDERRHLSRELHDELGQRLSALKMELGALAARCADTSLAARLSELTQAVDDTIVSARRISADLRPAMLDDLGLSAALDWLAQDWAARAGMLVRTAADDVDELVNDMAATAIYRIVQEALTNISRHARATRADIDLRHDDTELLLSVEDDGAGLAPGDTDKRGSHGLLGIRERARALGGSARVANRSQGGCRLEVRLPLARIDSRPGALVRP